MRETVELLAKGVFAYERPEITASVENIEISAETGKIFKGSFVVRNLAGTAFKGVVYSSESQLVIEEKTFTGAENEIGYSFDARFLDAGDEVYATITVVSDCGELKIPVSAEVTSASFATSVGPVSDMFNFASLAQINRTEARNLFKSEEFAHNLLTFDPQNSTLYRTLARSGNPSLALEEFLVAVHKKKQVCITVTPSSQSYEDVTGKLTDFVTITRDTWGFTQLSVEVTGDFIECREHIIWTDDFSENAYKLEYTINPDRMRRGVNRGTIRITSLRHEIVIDITAKGISNDRKEELKRLKDKRLTVSLYEMFLDYKSGRMTAYKFSQEALGVLKTKSAINPEGIKEKLFKVWLMLIAGKETQARTLLQEITADNEWQEDSLFTYAFAFYLKAKLSRENEMAAEYGARVKELYNREPDARIFVLCIDLDTRERYSPQMRYDSLKRGTGESVNAFPVLLEAALIAGKEPTVLRDFSGFDLRVLWFAVRHGLINRNLAIQASILALRRKESSVLSIFVLKKSMKNFRQNETLEALCKHLIMMDDRSKDAFKWLSIGIAEQLKIRDLCEHCLQAAGRQIDEPLPKAMMSYFEDGFNVDDETKAIYYANTVRFYSAQDQIPFGLQKQIHAFAVSMLAQGYINDNLALLYNNLIEKNDLNEGIIDILPDVIYKYSLDTDWKQAITVKVTHKEMELEQTYAVKDGRAYIDIYTENPVILLEDEQGNCVIPRECSPQKLITNPDIIRVCTDNCDNDYRVALGLLERAHYGQNEGNLAKLLNICIEKGENEEHFDTECRRELIEYYYDNLESELMEELLVKLNLAKLSGHDRARMLELMIMSELYSLTLRNIEIYGFFGIDVKRLMKLASKLAPDKTESPVLVDICAAVFKKRRYDNSILEYLERNYNGDSDFMYEIWMTARENGVDTSHLEERLLAQLLFTESDMVYSREIFRSFYSHGGSGLLVDAYLSYHAYRYLVYDQHPGNDILELMYREEACDDKDVCTLALLKALSGNETFSEGDRQFIESRMVKMERKGIVLPLFRKFPAEIKLPENIRDKFFIEYHSDPRKRVKIHYCMLGEDDGSRFLTEDMRDVGYGIFIKEFVLFYGEVLQYYITEDDAANTIITESSEVYLEPELIGSEETKYHQLNLIITSREMDDRKTMQKMLETYVRNEYMCNRLFKPI